MISLNWKAGADRSAASVGSFERWRHRDGNQVSRDDAVGKLVDMLRG